MSSSTLNPQPAIAGARPSVSVIICTYNRASKLRKTLQGFGQMAVPSGLQWELLIIDNNSTDDTKPVCAEFTSRLPIRYIFEPRQGKSYALNLGVNNSQGDLLIFTDDDVMVEPQFITNYLDATQRHPGATFFGGKVLPSWEAPPPRWVIENLGRLHINVHVDRGDRECSITDLMKPGEMPFLVGANLAIRKTAFEHGLAFSHEIGPMGADIYVSGNLRGEEIEVEKKLLRAGHIGIYLPTAIVHHAHPMYRQTEKYLRLWYSGAGATAVRLSPTLPEGNYWFGVPRYVWKTFCIKAVSYLALRWTCSSWAWLKAERDMAFTWGQIYEYRRITRQKSICRHPAN